MATYTNHYEMTKQQSPEHVSVGLLNDNFDIIDGVMFANQEKSEQLADDYNASETYNTGDYVRRENYLYKCNTDNTTGTWDDTKWDRVKVMDEISQGGGGGSSTLAGLDDVSLATPTNGQLLGYNGTSHKWENVNGGGGGSSTFAGLNDVNVQGVSNGDIARYNSTTGKWTDSSDLSDLELTVSQLQASVLAITDGHTILDSSGTEMAQEDGLQFASGCVEDDAVNGKTVYIEMIRISQANYDTLKANGQLKPGAKYFIYDAQPVAVNASNLPYSSTQSTKQKIDSLITEGTATAGSNKLTVYRAKYIVIDKIVFVTAVIGVGTTLSASDPILGNLPAVADSNSNVGSIHPQHDVADQSVITARMYQTALYTNKANQLLANQVYYITAQYFTT